MSFTEAAYKAADARLRTNEVAVIKAVSEVESNGVTHWKDGRVPILFEAQWFHKFTNGAYDATHPNISSPYWNRSLYIGGYPEYDRLAEASALDKGAAEKSASWGAFQVMGFNFADLGYANIDEFVAAMQTDEGQMEGFVRYIERHHLDAALRNHDWRTFAYGYNGSGAVDEYAPKMERAYEKYRDGSSPESPGIVNLHRGNVGANVVLLQTALGIGADGVFGRMTEAAVKSYQSSAGLVADGIVGPITWAKLNLH